MAVSEHISPFYHVGVCEGLNVDSFFSNFVKKGHFPLANLYANGVYYMYKWNLLKPVLLLGRSRNY